MTTKSLFFGGVDEHLSIGNAAALRFERTDAFSVSLWFKASGDLSSGAYLLSKQETSGNFRGYAIQIQGDGTIRFRLVNTGSNWIHVDTIETFCDGRWHHLVVTYDGSSTAAGVAIYVDTEPAMLSLAADSLAATILTTAPFQVSGRNGTDSPYSGGVDEVAVYNKELSTAEVSTVYGAGDPPDLVSVGPTANLVGYWRMGDGPGDSFPDIKDDAVSVSAVLASGTIRDRSVNGNDGTPTNMEDGDFTSDTPGGSGFSTTFGGVNEYIAIGNVAATQFERTDPFSVSFWIKFTSGGIMAIVCKMGTFSTHRGWDVHTAGGEIAITMNNSFGGNNFITVETQDAFNDGFWHHVVVTYDGSSSAAGVTIYVDDSAVGLTIQKDTLTGTILNSEQFAIGRRQNSSPDIPFTGQLDEVCLYDKELSVAEVSAIYNGGSPVNNMLLPTASNVVGYWRMGEEYNDGTMTNMEAGDISDDVPTTAAGTTLPAEFSVVLDGTNEHATIGNVSELSFERTDAFSIAAWVKTSVVTGFDTIMSKREGGGSFRGWNIARDNAGSLYLALSNTLGANELFVKTTASFADGGWHHFVATYDGSSNASGVNLYVDGNLEPKTVANNSLSATILNAAAASIGSLNGAVDFWQGSILDVAVYRRELGAHEVSSLYNGRYPADLLRHGPVHDLVGWWRMGDGDTYPNLIDNSASGNDATLQNTEAGDVVEDSPVLTETSSNAVLAPLTEGLVDEPDGMVLAFDIGSGVAADAIAPVIGNFQPTPGGQIEKLTPIQFDVTDDSGTFARIIVVAFISSTGIEEVVHDGDSFRGLYANSGSSVILIASGFRYVVSRTSGWPAGAKVTFRAFAIDSSGNENN